MKRCLLLVLLCVCATAIFAQIQPKREMRGAWIATVSNIDFPSSRNLTPDQQRAEFISILNQHKASGMNAVFVQIRCNGDALYPSEIEPWAEWLTGLQGRAPAPFYDPLAFMIEECRKRGMEFHAWFNPYRAVSNVNTAVLAANHVANLRPDWLLAYGNLRILDPGLPEVRAHVTRVVMEVVRKYDIDGVHFDDYFYPYPQTGFVLNDDSTYIRFNRGIPRREDWRRDNVNLLIKNLADSIKAAKPWVKFGISPFGIWQNKSSSQPLGSDTRGLQSFNDIFADSRAWIQQNWVDYLAPQLYWHINFAVADYKILLPWWAQNGFGRHIYVGQGAYRISADTNWNAAQMPLQIQLNRATTGIFGSLYYNTTSVNRNLLGFRDSLRNNYYRFPALPPTMPWRDSIPPPAPQSLTVETQTAGNRLAWVRPNAGTAELQKVRGYVVYRFKDGELVDLNRGQNVLFVTPNDTLNFLDTDIGARGTRRFTYVVTAFDRLYNESAASNTVSVTLTSVDQRVAESTQLLPAYPNPFAERVTIPYRLASAAKVRLSIVDVTGKTVATLVDEYQNAGDYSVDFDGLSLGSGAYFCVLESAEGKSVRKLMHVR